MLIDKAFSQTVQNDVNLVEIQQRQKMTISFIKNFVRMDVHDSIFGWWCECGGREEATTLDGMSVCVLFVTTE